MAKNKLLLKIHAKKYIEQVFASRLREEGFFCPDDRYLCWYRFFGEEVVHSIVFFTCWNHLPIMFLVGYGIHPLFNRPAYTTEVNYSERPLDHETFTQQVLVEKGPVDEMGYRLYSEDILVDAPGRDGRGLYTLDGIILPKMKGIETIENCYQYHKQEYLNSGIRDFSKYFNPPSGVFIDEALYFEDRDMYPSCIARAERVVESYKELLMMKPEDREYKRELREWEQRKNALLSGDHNAYLEILEKRRIANIAYLKKRR